ncbi:MAG: guanylate kinase [Bacteroidales bacterium]|nr:guanylate kinase [Bacteroidales bacterium]
MDNKLIILSAPSGSGKTTIAKRLLESGMNLEFSVSATSRLQRYYEIEGKDYYFLNADKFKEKINKGEFLEWVEVYKNCFYGTLKSEIDRIRNNGNNIVFDVDVVGGVNIKTLYKEAAILIFIKPPSIEVLEERLKKRGTETEKTLKIRIDRAKMELTYEDKFDKIIINDDLEIAVKETINTVTAFISK